MTVPVSCNTATILAETLSGSIASGRYIIEQKERFRELRGIGYCPLRSVEQRRPKAR